MIDFDDLDVVEAVRGTQSGGRPPCSACLRAGPTSPASRCARERQRPSLRPRGPAAVGGRRPAAGSGVVYGLEVPGSVGQLWQLGPAWLTSAFRAADTLGLGAEVAAIRGVWELGRRGAAAQFLLRVRYRLPQDGAPPGELLLRLGPVGGDQLSTWPRPQFQNFLDEVNFYRFFEGDSPLRMPRFYYGDVSDDTGRFVFITEWVPRPEELSLEFGHLGEVPCCIEGCHGYFLASQIPGEGAICQDNVVAKPYMAPLSEIDAARWILIPLPGHSPSQYLLRSASSGFYFCVRGGDQELYMSVAETVAEKWRVTPVPGESQVYILTCGQGANLASLDDEQQTLYMSSHQRKRERWRVLHGVSAAAQTRHVDLQHVSLHTTKAILAAGARLAAQHRSGALVPTDQHGDGLDDARAELSDGPPEFLGLADGDFIEKATQAQEFMTRVGAAVFPPGVITPSVMKEFRAVLVTAHANPAEWRWCLEKDSDYLGLGPDRFYVNSFFLVRTEEGQQHVGLRDWEGVSVGSLGAKLWRWLSFADEVVVKSRCWELLQHFIDVYHSSGGPELDLKYVILHYTLAAASESVRLLDLVPELYRRIPKDEWTSIEGLSDPKILGDPPLWHSLRCFVQVALALKHCQLSQILEYWNPYIFLGRLVGMAPVGYTVTIDGLEVRAEPTPGSPLVYRLPLGLGVVASGEAGGAASGEAQEHDPEAHAGLTRLTVPAPGWAPARGLRRDDAATRKNWGPSSCRLDSVSTMFCVMSQTRRQYTGCNPANMEDISAAKLQDELFLAERNSAFLELLGHGGIRVVNGSFLAERRRLSWWPADYEHWAHHTFVAFEDGTIADITADQYDAVPQLWYPADQGRYTLDFAAADAAYVVRHQTVGLQKWEELTARDDSTSGHRWWAVERKRLQKLRAAKGGLVLREGEPMPLPTASRFMQLQAGGPSTTFQRLTKETELEVWLVDRLFSREEVRRLVVCCESRQGFQPSLQKSTDGAVVSDGRRTSSSCAMLWPSLGGHRLERLRAEWGAEHVEEELAVVQKTMERCSTVLGVDLACIEPLQLVKYQPGQFYRPHLDTHAEPDRRSSYGGEQRTHTLLVFMNDVPESDGGGHLHFPLLALRVLPRAGAAVLWRNVRPGEGCVPDPEALHEGAPPHRSEKVAMNVWAVDRPFRAEPRLEADVRAGPTPQ